MPKTLWLVGLMCFCLWACEANTSSKRLNDLILSNGDLVSTCEQYTLGRTVHTIQETVNNTMLASEYLPCSLTKTVSLTDSTSKQIASRLLSLGVRQIPLSISPRYGRKSSLKEAGFTQDRNQLIWSDGAHNVTLQVKAKSSTEANQYLIWVSDVIADANYYGYYPVWFKYSEDTLQFEAVPFYASGY